MIRAETADRLRRTRYYAERIAEKHRGDLARKHQIQTEAMQRRHRSELTAVERRAGSG